MAAEEKSQSEKFIEKAKELGADESEEAFEAALKKILPATKPTENPKKDD
jgi:hypothetical protein